MSSILTVSIYGGLYMYQISVPCAIYISYVNSKFNHYNYNIGTFKKLIIMIVQYINYVLRYLHHTSYVARDWIALRVKVHLKAWLRSSIPDIDAP